MLCVVVLLIPGLYAGLLWNTYRGQRARKKDGKGYQPRDGAVRWVDDDKDSSDPGQTD